MPISIMFAPLEARLAAMEKQSTRFEQEIAVHRIQNQELFARNQLLLEENARFRSELARRDARTFLIQALLARAHPTKHAMPSLLALRTA